MKNSIVFFNRKNAVCLLAQVTVYRSLWGFFRGLMFSRQKAVLFDLPLKSILFGIGWSKKISLQSWFVFFPLQVIGINGDGKITEVKTLLPFSFLSLKCPVKYILEVPLSQRVNVKVEMTVKIKSS